MRRRAASTAVFGLIVVGAFLLGGLIDGRVTQSDPAATPVPVEGVSREDASPSPQSPSSDDRNRPAGSQILSEEQLRELGGVVVDALGGNARADAGTGEDWSEEFGPASVVLRRGGRALAEAGGEGDTAQGAVRSALEAALDELGFEGSPDEVDAVEVTLSHSFEELDLPNDVSTAVLPNVHRGVWGLEVTHRDESIVISPTRMLATNRDFERSLAVALQEFGVPPMQARDSVTARRFEAEQVLVVLDGAPTVHRMERGNTYVPVEDVTRDAVETLVEDMGDWMRRAVHEDGRMTYKYWPSRGEESTANNMIRQWMATTALGRVADARDSDELWALTRENIAYNLDHFFTEEDGLGLIVEDGTKVKLGAVALAGRALVEHRDREDYADVEEALARMVDHLWREDGSFQTWYLPPGRGGQENFYPGEALYFWSALYADEQDPELLERFMRSYRYYREWHLDPVNRNPAFVPWHTQAYYEVWLETGDPDLADFVFEMNDWLLDVQQWDEVAYRDTKGRFYAPDRPFGPPHASSTGVYLEGLVDAYQLAQALDERDRAEAYRTAIVRGLRSVMQLQFVDDVDLYYISQRDRVLGGVRTEVYDNEIRVDNVQHNLMAALKILEAFSEDDFRP